MKSTAENQRTLGPVSDLERHLPANWWQSLFNAVYLKTDGDVVENDANTKREVDLIVRAVGLEPNDRIFDLCCGQGRHTLELARRGFRQVSGLDRSRYLIGLARRRAKAEGLNVRFREGDARKFHVSGGNLDCVMILGNSFGYFDQERDDVAVLNAVKRALRGQGRLVIDIADGDWLRSNFEKRTWEWIDQNHFVCRERSLSGDGDRLISREVVVHAEKGVIADQFYAERLYSRDRIRDVLDELGFRETRLHDDITTESNRGQDLGMMAHRFLITARAPEKPTVRKSGTVPFPQVAVLLGDPRLPDQVKRGGKFNMEDIETTNRLKEALSELDAYRFTYFDNHASLLADLREQRPAFVFNLCDEGYNNEATFELHVPAILETLGIPYSGAGPATLGICYNKAIVRSVAMSCEVPVPLETFFDPSDQAATLPSVFPALIKPCTGDSSIGITADAVVAHPEELVSYLTELRTSLPGRAVLVQEFLSGPEYTVGLIGNPGIGLAAQPVLEVDYSGLDPELPPILGYESKWHPESPYWTDIKYRPAELDDEVRRDLIDWSTTLFERLGCRDYARFDFRADAEGTIKLLEVNPNPGWSWDAKMNLMAEFEGKRYADLLCTMLESAQQRIALEFVNKQAVAA